MLMSHSLGCTTLSFSILATAAGSSPDRCPGRRGRARARPRPGRLDEHDPRPDGVPASTAWAGEEPARRRFEPHVEVLERRTRTVRLAFPSADAMFDALARPLGVGDASRATFDRLLAAQNNRPPAAEIDARYVLYAGRRRG
jgi:hypothetical protein